MIPARLCNNMGSNFRTSTCVIVCFFLVFICTAAFAQSGYVSELLIQGSDSQYKGNLDEAEYAFSQVLQVEPDNAYARNQLALVYVKKERIPEAMRLFRQVVEREPENTFAGIWIGVLYLQLNQPEDAEQTFMAVLERDPANANACYFLGVISAVKHNGAKAIWWLRKAQEYGSDDPETHVRLARAFLSLSMPMNARLEFERTLALDSRHTKALNALGWVLYNQGYVKQALERWERTLTINTQDREARASLAKVTNEQALGAWQNGDAVRARNLWNKTLQFEPQNKAAKYYLHKAGR